MMAEELAKSMAPPTPWPIRMPISQMAPAGPCIQVTESRIENSGEDGEPEVVHLHAAEHVAHPAERHQQHGQDDHEAHEHPQHVAGVGRGQRGEVDAAEDGREGDQHDRLVDEDHERAEGDVGQGDPLVATLSRHRPGGIPSGAVRPAPADRRTSRRRDVRGANGGHDHHSNVDVKVM